MSKELEALERYRFLPTAIDYNIVENALKELEERREMMKRFNDACVPMVLDNETEKSLKVLELIKGINFDIVYREQFDEWTLFIVIKTQDGEYLEPVTFGSGKEQYELLKEVLL